MRLFDYGTYQYILAFFAGGIYGSLDSELRVFIIHDEIHEYISGVVGRKFLPS